jgi:hypothetical protein
MAHVEGFQRSPADVTASRLMKNGLAPVIKEAFEEIFKAPYIAKILLAEVGSIQDRDRLFTINYDGMFEEQREFAFLAASSSLRGLLAQEWKTHGPLLSLSAALEGSPVCFKPRLLHGLRKRRETPLHQQLLCPLFLMMKRLPLGLEKRSPKKPWNVCSWIGRVGKWKPIAL